MAIVKQLQDTSGTNHDISASYAEVVNSEGTVETKDINEVLCPYIVGTQDSRTSSWTGDAPFAELSAGQSIKYKLPYKGYEHYIGESEIDESITLTLTLTDGTDTDAIPVYDAYYNVPASMSFPEDSILSLTYDGTYWRLSHELYYDASWLYDYENELVETASEEKFNELVATVKSLRPIFISSSPPERIIGGDQHTNYGIYHADYHIEPFDATHMNRYVNLTSVCNFGTNYINSVHRIDVSETWRKTGFEPRYIYRKSISVSDEFIQIDTFDAYADTDTGEYVFTSYTAGELLRIPFTYSFSDVVVGQDTISANSAYDSIGFIAGNNITLTPDTTNKTITIAASGGSSGDNKTPLISIVPTSSTTIDPYKMYDLGTVSSAITIVFNTSAEVSGYCAEYLLKFVAGSGCAISLPNGVIYSGGSAPTYVSGRTYEINVCNGLAVVGEFY